MLEVQIDRPTRGVERHQTARHHAQLVDGDLVVTVRRPQLLARSQDGVGYQVQVEIPQGSIRTAEALAELPVKSSNGTALLLRDVANIVPA